LTWSVTVADCRYYLARLAPESVDSIVCDPPYELGFMARAWDSTGIAYDVDVWKLALRAAKPGAHLIAFGGSRTYHRLAVAIEDAGWQIRDQIQWIYGSGFPKSLDVSKAIDRRRYDRDQVYRVTGWIRRERDRRGLSNSDIDRAFGFHGMAGHWTSAASQPSVPTLDQIPRLFEVLGIEIESVPPEIRDLIWTLNGRKGQPGAAWFDRESTRIAGDRGGFAGDRLGNAGNPARDVPATAEAHQWAGWGTALKPAHEPAVLARKPFARTVAENVLQHGTGALNIDGSRVGTDPRHNASASSNEIFGQLKGEETGGRATKGRWPANVIHDGSEEAIAGFPDVVSGSRAAGEYAASGGVAFGAYRKACFGPIVGSGGTAARYFYAAKASRDEREGGLDGLPLRTSSELTGRADGSAGLDSPRAGAGRTSGRRNAHPTVKPVDLMRYCVKLITPPGGLVLDPFTGSGSTGCGAVLEGFDFIGCDLSPEYAAIARARIAHWETARGLTAAEARARDESGTAAAKHGEQLGLFS